MMEKFELKNYEPKYLDEIFKIQANQWGENSDSDEIFDHIQDYDVKLLVCKEKLIGFYICHKLDETTYYLDMIMLDKEHQHMHLGSLMMEDILKNAKNLGVKKITCVAIEAKGITNSKNLLEKNNFIKIRSIKNYWGVLCPDFDCKECGHKPCQCTMHEYTKVL